jgi:predicted RNase H-like nuclease (RuvC/YqgF family)
MAPVIKVQKTEKKSKKTKKELVEKVEDLAEEIQEIAEDLQEIEAETAEAVEVPEAVEAPDAEDKKAIRAEKKERKLEEERISLAIQIEETAAVLKDLKKRLRKITPRKNSNGGILKPTKISKKLAKYIGVPEDSLHNRPSVTKKLAKIFEERGLKDKFDILVEKDKKLKDLLGSPIYLKRPSDESLGHGYTWYNFQRYLNPHFIAVEQ